MQGQLIKKGLIFASILIILLWAGLFAVPSIVAKSGVIAPGGTMYTVRPNSWDAVPFGLPTTSKISGAFQASQPVELFILTPSQFYSMNQGGYLGSFEFANGNLISGVIDTVMPAGEYYLLFYSFTPTENTQTSVYITSPIFSTPVPNTLLNSSSSQVLVPTGAKYTLLPGQYVAVRFNLTNNASTTVQGVFSLSPPTSNSFNYYEFQTISYIMTQKQFAGFLLGKNTNAVYSTVSGFFPNGLNVNLPAGDYYFITANPNPAEAANLTFTRGLTIRTPNSINNNVATSVGTLEYIVNFTETGNLYAGVPFSVSLNGATQQSPGFILFLERNGTYSWSLVSIDSSIVSAKSGNEGVAAGFLASPVTGEINVNGKAVTVVIDFSEIKYSISFVETGLPQGMTWSVSMNITTISSTTNQIVFYLPNYSQYSFTVIAPAGYVASPASGKVDLMGVNLTEIITFTPVSTGSLTLSSQWKVNSCEHCFYFEHKFPR